MKPHLPSKLNFDESESLIYDLTYLLTQKFITLREAYKLITPFLNLLAPEIDKGYMNGLIGDLYEGTVPFQHTNGSLGIVKLLMKHGVNSETSQRLKNSIIEELLDDEEKDSIKCPIGDDEEALVSHNSKEIYYVSIRNVNGRDQSKKKTVISAYPSKIIIYDSPITGDPRRFKIVWKTRTGKVFTEGPALLSDITQLLIDSGYVINPQLVKSVLPAVTTHYLYEGLAQVMDEIDYPGFFYKEQEKELISVKYDVTPPSKEELIQSVDLLDDLAPHFKGEEDKLATSIKWGLMAPYSYVKKQLGAWMPWLYLFGTAGSGKTTIGKIILYLYIEPNQDNDLGGSSFDTVARVGNRLSQSTFPIIVNEPKGAFDRASVVEMFKTAVQSTVARGKYEGRSYTNIPAFNPVILTSNHYIPTDDALMRRLEIILFSHQERKTKDEKKLFEERFQPDNSHYSPLKHLQAIGRFFYNELYHDPSLLSDNWKDVTNQLLNRLYVDLGREPPSWLMSWHRTESLEDLDEDQREDIRIFLLEEINRVSRSVQWRDEEDRPVDQSLTQYTGDKEEFKNRLEQILQSKLLPWMIMVNRNEKDYVCFTSGFKKVIHKNTEVCMALKSIGELLGWKYMTEKKLTRPRKVIRVSFDELLDFLYL